MSITKIKEVVLLYIFIFISIPDFSSYNDGERWRWMCLRFFLSSNLKGISIFLWDSSFLKWFRLILSINLFFFLLTTYTTAYVECMCVMWTCKSAHVLSIFHQILGCIVRNIMFSGRMSKVCKLFYDCFSFRYFFKLQSLFL